MIKVSYGPFSSDSQEKWKIEFAKSRVMRGKSGPNCGISGRAPWTWSGRPSQPARAALTIQLDRASDKGRDLCPKLPRERLLHLLRLTPKFGGTTSLSRIYMGCEATPWPPLHFRTAGIARGHPARQSEGAIAEVLPVACRPLLEGFLAGEPRRGDEVGVGITASRSI